MYSSFWTENMFGKQRKMNLQGAFFNFPPLNLAKSQSLYKIPYFNFFSPIGLLGLGLSQRGTSALHLNEATWIIDGSNELILDFLFALVLFLDSTQPRPFKNPKQIFFFWTFLLPSQP